MNVVLIHVLVVVLLKLYAVVTIIKQLAVVQMDILVIHLLHALRFQVIWNFPLPFWFFVSVQRIIFVHNFIFIVYYEPEITACQTNPCGINAVCAEKDNAGSCSCLPEYYGDPYVECRPECVMNSDCPMTKSCVNMKCIDPCIGVCGAYAECFVANHAPYCTCLCGYTGNPSVGCYEIPKRMCLSEYVLLWWITLFAFE